MMNVRFSLLSLFASLLLASASLWGCASDDADDDTDVGDGSGQGGSCAGVVIAASVGEACGGTVGCADGATCAQLDDGRTLCLQDCLPNRCETVCGEEEVCAVMRGDEEKGACMPIPTGSQGDYDICSPSTDFCAAGLDCLTLSPTAEDGICLPPCARDACNPAGGRPGACVVLTGEGEEPSHCLPLCSAAGADDECPGELVCLQNGPGFVCGAP